MKLIGGYQVKPEHWQLQKIIAATSLYL